MNTIDTPSTRPAMPPAGTYKAHVGASSLGNPGPAGWAVILEAPDGSRRELFGSAPEATSNQMELWATLIALLSVPADAKVVVYVASKYAAGGLTKWRKDWARCGWLSAGGPPVLNGAIWRMLSRAADKRPNVRFVPATSLDVNDGSDLAKRIARREAQKVRSGHGSIGISGGILEDCAEEDAEANLRWMNAGDPGESCLRAQPGKLDRGRHPITPNIRGLEGRPIVPRKHAEVSK